VANKSNKLVVILFVVLIMAVMLIAFLLGRLGSMKEQPAVASTQQAEAMPSGKMKSAGPVHDVKPQVEHRQEENLFTDNAPLGGKIIEKNGHIFIIAQGEPDSEKPSTPAVKPTMSEPTRSVAPLPDQSKEIRGKVQDYLNKIGTLQSGPIGVSPDRFSESLAAGIANGNLDEFDKLVSEVKRVQDEAKAIQPPEPCRELHEEFLGIIGESREMLEEVRTALNANDITQLKVIESKAQVLQNKAQAIDGLMEKIRRQYGAL
jgi:hypothetical protein